METVACMMHLAAMLRIPVVRYISATATVLSEWHDATLRFTVC